MERRHAGRVRFLLAALLAGERLSWLSGSHIEKISGSGHARRQKPPKFGGGASEKVGNDLAAGKFRAAVIRNLDERHILDAVEDPDLVGRLWKDHPRVPFAECRLTRSRGNFLVTHGII